jgi:hypothetical protein
MLIIFRFSGENKPRGEVVSIVVYFFRCLNNDRLMALPNFAQKIFAMAKEKLPRPTKVGDHVSTLATDIHSASECNRRYGGLAKTQRVYGIARNIEKVLKPGNKVKTTQVTAGFDFGENSLGIRDFKMATLNVKRCLLEPSLELAAVLAVDHPPSERARTPPPAAAAATNNVPIIATADVPITIQAELPQNPQIRAELPPNTPIATAGLPPTVPTSCTDTIQAELPQNVTNQAELPPHINNQAELQAELPPANNPMNNLVGQPIMDLPVDVHGMVWEEDGQKAHSHQNEMVHPRPWRIRHASGEWLEVGCSFGQDLSKLEYFLALFPPEQLTAMLGLLNRRLEAAAKKEATTGELLKWFGVLILITRFEFGKRRDLWSTTAPSKYILAPDFGATGMARHRFEDIMRHVRWSDQPDERREGTGFKKHQWLLVDDFVERFNSHRAANVQPSELICVDESMSRWYGNGGD